MKNAELDATLADFVDQCHNTFGERLCFIGLQGSYRRGEATADSDIDLVVILDTLSAADLSAYRALLSTMPFAEKACGFCCGKHEVLHWPRHDLFQLVNDTKALYGSLLGLIPMLRRQDVQDAVRLNAANLYHAACHSFLYDNAPSDSLCALYKNTFFILQAIYFYRTQLYIETQRELLPRLSGSEAEILTLCMQRDQFASYSPAQTEAAYQTLIDWCSSLLSFA